MKEIFVNNLNIFIPAIIALVLFVTLSVRAMKSRLPNVIKDFIERDFKFRFQCEKCGEVFEIPAKEFYTKKYLTAMKKQMNRKQGSIYRVGGVVPVSMALTRATKSERHFECPVCHQMGWMNIINLDEYYEIFTPSMARQGVVLIAKILVYGVCTLIVMGIGHAIITAIMR